VYLEHELLLRDRNVSLPRDQRHSLLTNSGITTSLHMSCPVAHLTGQARKLGLESAAGRGIGAKNFLFFFGGAPWCCAARKQDGPFGRDGRRRSAATPRILRQQGQ
jgi:hypothetical protein